MNTQVIPTSVAPEVFIQQVLGDLSVRGWDQEQIVIQADENDLAIENLEDGIRLNCLGDCNLRVPSRATLNIDSVHGDVHIKNIQGELFLDNVHGSLTLRAVSGTQIDTVHGDFSAKEVDGSLQVCAIFGNAAVREIFGDCALRGVEGNLDLRRINGLVAADCRGNVRLRLDLLSEARSEVTADGNINCSLPPKTSVRLIMKSEAEMIKVRLPESAQVYQQPELVLELEDARAEMQLAAGGGLYVSFDEDNSQETFGGEAMTSDDFGQRIAQQVKAQVASHLEMVSQKIGEQMERMSDQFKAAGSSTEKTNRVIEKARWSSEQSAARAQEKIRLAQEKLERKLGAAQRQYVKKAPAVDNPAQASSVSSEKVAEEERLMILRMLEQKKITLEEADRLLSALEGKY